MNDRISKRPPSVYTREDDLVEHRSAQIRRTHPPPNRHTSLDGIGTYYDAGIDSSKPSGMDRFRRAIVNVFNPITTWAGLSNYREKREPLAEAEKRVMQARQVKAEKEYAELKENGFKGIQGLIAEKQGRVPANAQHNVEETRPNSHRDSGIDMEYRSSLERKSQLSTAGEGIMSPPSVPAPGRAASPFSEVSSSRKPTYFRKPSFKSLKTVKSHIQLSSTKRPNPPTIDSLDHDKSNALGMSDQNLRKQPSRKDVAKQQRLSKRVSDLETQLELARRNLKLSLSKDLLDVDTNLLTRSKPFVPGALPSLPSEGVLKAHIIDSKYRNNAEPLLEHSDATFSENQFLKQIATSERDHGIPDATAQLNHELQSSVSGQTGTKKRKHEAKDDKIASDEVNNKEDDAELDARKKPRLRRSSRPSLKTQKPKDAEVSQKPQQKPVPRTPRNSPLKHTEHAEPVPPLPVMSDSFNPAKVDQAKILAMRSQIQDTPFGRHPEDIKNLRKEFPTFTEALLSDYLMGLSEDNKATDHTSLPHHNQPVTPVLGPPRSASPIKVKSRKALDHHSSTRLSQYPSQLPPQVEEEEETQESNVAKVSSPLKEEYEWPEDVF